MSAAFALPPKGGCDGRKGGRVRDTCHNVGLECGGYSMQGYFFSSCLVTASLFPLISSLVSPFCFVHSLSSSVFIIVSCVIFLRVSCLLSVFSRLAATLSLLLSVFSLNPSPFHLLFCVFSLLSLPLSLFHVVSFFFSFISFVCPLTFFCRLVRCTCSRVSRLSSVYPSLSCTFTFLSSPLSLFLSLSSQLPLL